MTINGCVWPSTPGSALGPAGDSRSELTGWLVQTWSWSQPLHPYLGSRWGSDLWDTEEVESDSNAGGPKGSVCDKCCQRSPGLDPQLGGKGPGHQMPGQWVSSLGDWE